MSGISDEMLMAYADGELDGSASAAVEDYLANSPEAVERLRVFQATGRELSELFDQPMREPVPQRLIDAIKAPENIVAFDRAKRSERLKPFVTWPTALAASLAFLAASGTAYWLTSQDHSPANNLAGVEQANGERRAARALASVLETGLSGTPVDGVTDDKKITIEPIYTFATANQQYCRQYVITMQDATAYGGVACKAPDGVWRIEAHEAIDASRPSSAGRIAPAGGNAGQKSIEDAIDRLIEGDVLRPEAERAAMARSWKSAE